MKRECCDALVELRLMESPPMRGRGLKREGRTVKSNIIAVAPHAGAWIETFNDAS
mgnify:CR=1 FL=1